MTQTIPAVAARAPSAEFKPYVLWRRGLLAVSALAGLVPAGAWVLIEEREKHLEDRRELAQRLGDLLYELIPSLEPKDRRRVLQLRRDVHNDRWPCDGEEAAVEHLLNAASRAAFREWRRSWRSDRVRDATVAARLADELQAARSSLGRIASGEHFLQGIQLSGSHLYRNVRDYAALARRLATPISTRQLRQTESTLVRYACRMALRTSPFGSFTEIGAQSWRPLPPSTERPPRGHRHLVRLNRGLLDWMSHQLHHLEGSDRLLRVRLNNTADIRDGRLEVFTRGMDGGAQGYWGERFVSVRVVGALAVMTEALAHGPLPREEVLHRLVDEGLPAQQAAAFLNRLVDAGVCHYDLALPDQTTSFAEAAAVRLRAIPTGDAAACAEAFETLQRIEYEMGTGTVDERDRLLENLTREVRRFAQICGVSAPLSVARSLVFEDVAADQPPCTWDPDLLERNAYQFGRLQRLLPMLDDATFEKLGLYHWFVSRFGEDGRCEDLLSLYRSFAEQPPTQISAIMQGVDLKWAEQLRRLQRELRQRLEYAIDREPGAPTLHVDERCLDDLLSSLPAFLPPWTDASYRVQLLPGNAAGSPLVIINDVTAGHGVFFSRFCDLLEPSEPGAWSLRCALREAISRGTPRQADLTAVLGLNVNLHPSLTPLEIVYPGSIASDGNVSLSLRDLAVEADSARSRLRLINRHDGGPVELTPMNFLFPTAAPMLYRFLCVLAPVHFYRISLWNHLRQRGRRPRRELPRLILGDLVLERRRWYVPAATVCELRGSATGETVADLRATQAWYQRLGLPVEGFFRVQEWTGGRDATRDWVSETRRWAVSARRARRKGQYFDFRSPFLVRLLVEEARAAGDAEVLFQECLPPTRFYGQHDAPESAEDFLVEARIPPANEP